MDKKINLIGVKGKNSEVICFHGVVSYQYKWKCLCVCGKFFLKDGHSIRSGKLDSCGCVSKKIMNAKKTKHGMFGTKEYGTYYSARRRCVNKKDKSYISYGGRGIKFKFNSFDEFYKYIGKAPTKKHTLDRIDNNGNYEKGNVRWASVEEQQNNKSNNIMITYEGEILSASQWARKLDINIHTLMGRINGGNLSVERILNNKKIIGKMVVKKSLCGKITKEYDSIKEAVIDSGTSISSITSVCKGRKESVKGYKWEYIK